MEVRLRSKVSEEELGKKLGRIITEKDFNLLVTNKCKVLKPDGSTLLIYLPKAIPEDVAEQGYDILHTIQGVTDNRGMASGSVRKRVGTTTGKITRANNVRSSIIGYVDPSKNWHPYCRTTAWTGDHAESFVGLIPMFQSCADNFEKYVPDRYAVQKRRCNSTKQEWVISGTPYTTITVNNTYPTGVHKDAGDLHEGFSNLAVLRRGDYSGGILSFPEYRVGIDLQDRDIILMDAHEWHGNTQLDLKSDDAERISLVLYYRTNMLQCGTAEDEIEKAKDMGIKWYTEEQLDALDIKASVSLGTGNGKLPLDN